jgi:hypothetical protein
MLDRPRKEETEEDDSIIFRAEDGGEDALEQKVQKLFCWIDVVVTET